MPQHTESILPNIRGYLRSSIKWSQSATSDTILFDAYQTFSASMALMTMSLYQLLTTQTASHKNRLDRFDSHIVFMRPVADNSLIYMNKSNVNFMSIWFIYT